MDKYEGIYINGLSNLEKEIIQYFKYFTNYLPLSSTLLLCDEYTTSEEIISFLYRSILCTEHICFCIARTECLSKENKSLIVNILKEQLEERPKMKSCLFIMNKNLEDELCKSLFNLKFVKTMEMIKDIEKEKITDENIKVVNSDNSGAGKSTFIKSQTNNEYIYFPIGGVFSKEEILERLQNIDKEKNINNKNDLLFHVDLYDTEQKSIMNDFLYFILITKSITNRNNIFYLSKKIKIYLEIPNSFINFFEKFPILDLIDKKYIEQIKLDELPPLIVPDNILSNVRIVSLFLKLRGEENTIKKGLNERIFKSNNKIDKNQIMFPNSDKDLVWESEERNYNDIVIKAENENKDLTQEICQKLIMSVIGEIKPTYYQINTFINVLASQLIQFNKNHFLSPCTLIDSKKYELCKIRSKIVDNFISLTKYFTKGAFTQLTKNQKEIQNKLKYKNYEKEKLQKANEILENYPHESISFDKMDLAFVFFHGGKIGTGFSVITNRKPEDATYKEFLELINFQTYDNLLVKKKQEENNKREFLEGIKALPDFKSKSFGQEKFLEELKNILDINNPYSYEENENDENHEYKSLKEIADNYVFTADNFLKMCFILIRIRANIPIIMMGETGCGKTFLIKKLSELKNNGNKKALIIDNIHAGHTNKDIIRFIEEEVLPKAEELKKLEEERKKLFTNGIEFEEEKLWVFFDELNTCKSMDLLSEIICKHSYLGKPLPDNIVFIGASNPYRAKKQKQVGLKLKNKDIYQVSDLVYSVNPMPHSLLSYVFDFGSIDPDDEKAYIEAMIKGSIHNEIELAKNLIIEAQNFVRNNNEVSSVSLREIKRFTEFYEFFLDYYDKKAKIMDINADKDYLKLITEHKSELSINLSIYLSYYLRLSDSSEQDNLRKKLSEKLNIIYQRKINMDFLEIPKKEQNFIADNVDLDKSIARNRALLENLFSLFVCINKKIPIFIIGKPGTSKSLSIQIIINSMRGKSSKNKFFKLYPRMYLNTYQGALNSDSEGVEKIFAIARKILKEDEKNEIISTILFDEMGLAEHSIHNPLKVIHSNLEYDLNDENDNKKVSFVGVSNWELDSAKMNRGITIRIPELNIDDIKLLSITIGKSFLLEKLDKTIEYFFESLGISYFKYKEEFKNNNRYKEYENFHGNRDFYHLIKYFAVKIKEEINKNNNINKELLIQLALRSLARNFGGLELHDGKTGLDLIIGKFLEHIGEENNINNQNIKNVRYWILDNLTDYSDEYLSRYLLLITKSNIGIHLLTQFLKNNYEYDNYNIFIGSVFKDDIEKEEYTAKILNKIKLKMEKEHILILKNLDSIYTSLYDLFNQNPEKIRNKRYARIALGSRTNFKSEVNDKFRCIIIVDENKLEEQEIPFLNRFEKQCLSFQYLMRDEEISKANEIFEKCQNIVNYDENKFKLFNYNIGNLLINCGLEEINGIIYVNKDNNDINNEHLLANKISWILPQDIILLLLVNKKNWNNNKKLSSFYNEILNEYNKNNYNNIKNFLSYYMNKKNKTNKIIIYTFTRIIDDIKENYLENFGGVVNIKISSIKNENNLENEIEEFLSNKNKKMCIIKFLPYEYFIIDYLKTIIENKEIELDIKPNQDKIFIFLVHLEREFINNQNIEENNLNSSKKLFGSLSNLANYTQIFIDDINGEDFFYKGEIVNIIKLCDMNIYDLYTTFINKKNIFLECLYSILCLFDFSFYTNDVRLKEINKDKYIDMIISLFENNGEYLNNILDEIIIKNIKNKHFDDKQNILEEIIENKLFSRGDICIMDIIKNMLKKNYIDEFKAIYIELEKNYFFSSLLKRLDYFIDNINKEKIEEDRKLNEIIMNLFLKSFNLENKNHENGNIEVYFDFSLPSKTLLEKMDDYIKNNIIINYEKNENNFRNLFFDEDEEEENNYLKKQYQNNLSILESNTDKYFIQLEIINVIQNNSKGIKSKIFKLLFEDYLFYIINKNKNYITVNKKDNIKPFLDVLINYKFETKENENLESISKKMLWLEAYYIDYIIPIIKFFLFLESLEIKNIFELLNKNNFGDIDKNQGIKENKKIVNKSFYNIISSLLRIFFLNLNAIIDKINEEKILKKFVDDLVNNLELLRDVNNRLDLDCKDLFLFEEMVKIMKFILLDETANNNLEKQKQLILYKNSKINIFDEKDGEKNLIKQDKNERAKLNFLKDILKNNETDNSDKLFSSILINEYKKTLSKEYKKHILETILERENLIQQNIILIMDCYSIIKKDIDAFVTISNEESSFPSLNESPKAEKAIIKVFTLIINIKFDSLTNDDLFSTDLFDIFKRYLNSLTNDKDDDYYNNNENGNLLKLYAISYIKIYLIRCFTKILENKNIYIGKATNIIKEIIRSNSFKNTLFIYVIIILNNKLMSDTLKDDNFKDILEFQNHFKEKYGEDKFNEIIKFCKIPEEIDYPFIKYFGEINFPTFNDFKNNLLSSNQNEKKYPLLWFYIKYEKEISNLKYLLDYNNFINTMINHFSWKISREEAKNKNLNEDDIFKDENFIKIFNDFKKIFNNILFIDEKIKLDDNNNLAYFLIDDDEKQNFGIWLKKGLEKFIKWNNEFLNRIINSEGNKYLSYYKSSLKLEEDIQKVNKYHIINIDSNLKETVFINFKGLITLYSNYKASREDNTSKFEYNFDKIEEELAKIILPNKCLFNEKKFDLIIYKNEGWKKIKNDYLINFEDKYGSESLTDNDRKNIYHYVEKNNYNFYSIFNEQFVILINYLVGKSKSKNETSINDCIEEAKKKFIKFHKYFTEFFSNEGKEINISKLLECISYFEFLCFYKLRNNINEKYNTAQDDIIKNNIESYFNNEHKDTVITQKEITIAVRRFILKILLDEKIEEIASTTSLYLNLYRKDLWNNKIFKVYQNDLDFEGKVKEYLNKFPLKTSDSLWFYNIIGKNELKLIGEYKQKYEAENNNPQPQGDQNLNLDFNFNPPNPEKQKGKTMKKKKEKQNVDNNNNNQMNINMNNDIINVDNNNKINEHNNIK